MTWKDFIIPLAFALFTMFSYLKGPENVFYQCIGGWSVMLGMYSRVFMDDLAARRKKAREGKVVRLFTGTDD